MEKMEIYEKCQQVPDEAKKPIAAGRLKGMTDINPMWRIKALTELFGPCGVGWKITPKGETIVEGARNEKVAFSEIELYIKVDGEWSDAIPGTGGAAFVSMERGGLHTSDEAFKMARTDALSVACKLLGIGADVYWEAGRSKYTQQEAPQKPILCDACGQEIRHKKAKGKVYTPEQIADISQGKYKKILCWECMKKQAGGAADGNQGG